jgi:hypothetical protein
MEVLEVQKSLQFFNCSLDGGLYSDLVALLIGKGPNVFQNKIIYGPLRQSDMMDDKKSSIRLVRIILNVQYKIK